MRTQINFRTAILLCCSFMVSTTIGAISPKKNNSSKNQPVTVINHDAVNNFVADRISFKKEMALKELSVITEISLNTQLNEEARLFPADDLYGSHWENKYVDPTRGLNLTMPDSCNIDCSSFILPIQEFTKITSKYGPRRRRMHNGIDLKVQIGDTIRSAFDGRVRIISYERRGYGKYIVIRHPNGLETIYGHLSGYLVKENEYVRAGSPIGLGGNTGRSTGSHLHFETRFLGQAINPAEIIDFENGVPHRDNYVFRNVKINGRKSNIYTSSNNQLVYHRVKKGDSLGKIAKMYGTTVSQLCRLNGIKETSTLHPGQSIRCSNGASVNVSSASQAKTVAQKTTTAQTQPASATPAVSKTSTATGETQNAVYYRIQEGDCLSKIAEKNNTSVSKLCELNGITRKTILKPGKSLRCS